MWNEYGDWKFKDSLIGLRTILEEMVKTKIIERLEAVKIKEITKKRLKELEKNRWSRRVKKN